MASAAERVAPPWMAGMILVAAYTGLRLHEVAALRASDLKAPEGDGEPWTVLVRRGKGGYLDESSVCFSPALEVLQGAALALGPETLVFRTQRRTMVTRQTLAKHFPKVAAEAGFEGTFHALRHFHACWLIDGGAQVLDVALQLRHHDNGDLVRKVYGRYFSTREAFRRIATARG